MKTITERNTEDIDLITNDPIEIRDRTQQGIVNDAVRIDDCIEKNQDMPTGWRGIKRVPFARRED